jgi:allantoate deiminase
MTVGEAAHDAIRRCRWIAQQTEEPGRITRTFLSPPMRAVHGELSAWMAAAGMHTTVDAAGNLRGIYPGASGSSGALYLGSHLDTVPGAGAFDGVLGVVMAIALVHLVAPRRLPFDIDVIGFSEEEGVRFGIPFIGSRAFAGTLDDVALTARDSGGTSVREAICRFGLDPARLSEARFAASPLGYLEFHIEQGPVLDSHDLPVGIVQTIAGQSRAEVSFRGRAAHAGTTPMTMRHDALAGAAEWIGTVEIVALGTAGLVATVGRATVAPGAANVIPGECVLTVDVRHADDAIRRDAFERLNTAAQAIAARRELTIEWRQYLDQPATCMTPSLVSILERAVSAAGATAPLMTSGAGHDAMIVASHMPAGMLFVRSPGGISHHPDETVREEDVAVALATGLNALELLAGTVDG